MEWGMEKNEKGNAAKIRDKNFVAFFKCSDHWSISIIIISEKLVYSTTNVHFIKHRRWEKIKFQTHS